MQTEDLDRRRLAHLLRMLGSSHDGEVLNAARLADHHVRDRKLTRTVEISANGGKTISAVKANDKENEA